MQNIEIHLFGEFTLYVDGKRADDALLCSKKGLKLVEYMLLHNDELVSYKTLYKLFWPNRESVNNESALKTLVSRTRSILASISPLLKNLITTAHGTYCFNRDLKVKVDLFDFLECTKKLKYAVTDDEKMPLLNQALLFFQGDLLTNNAVENFVVEKNMQLQDEYMALVYQYVEILKNKEMYEDILAVAKRAQQYRAFDERLNVIIMAVFSKLNRKNDALQQYNHIVKQNAQRLNPSAFSEQDFYTFLLQSGKQLDDEINSIKEDVLFLNKNEVAVFCDYSVFKQFCKLELRLNERTVFTPFLALIQLSSAENDVPLSRLCLDQEMQTLKSILESSLRRGDIICKYDISKYALLLPIPTLTEGKNVLERIKTNFYKKTSTPSLLFSYRLTSLHQNTL